MAVQHIDIYHCLKCGELIYREHDAPAPDCCGAEMVRAVSDIRSEIEDDEVLPHQQGSDPREPRRRRFPAR